MDEQSDESTNRDVIGAGKGKSEIERLGSG